MMTNQTNQKISQFLDDDLARDDALSLFKNMQHDRQLQTKMQRYLLAQEALRAKPVMMADNDFLDKVKQELESEPVYLMPRKQSVKPLRKSSLLALAASIAALAIIIPVWTKSTLINPSAQMQLSQQQAVEAEPIERVRVYPVNQRFQDYLQAHNGSLYTNGTASSHVQTQLASYGQE